MYISGHAYGIFVAASHDGSQTSHYNGSTQRCSVTTGTTPLVQALSALNVTLE